MFTSQLEKSREATDASNIRAAYAEIAASALTDPEKPVSATISKKQLQTGWQSSASLKDIAGVAIGDINSNTATTVAYAPTNGVGDITIDGKAVASSFLNSSSGSSSSGGDSTGG